MYTDAMWSIVAVLATTLTLQSPEPALETRNRLPDLQAINSLLETLTREDPAANAAARAAFRNVRIIFIPGMAGSTLTQGKDVLW